MQAIADTLVQASTSAETKARRHAVVAYVRESLMRQDPDGYARTCDALAEAEPADARAIACPTLLVTGDEDGVAPPQSVRAMGGKIAGSQVEVLRGCGHWTPLEKADECIDILRRFYAGPARSDGDPAGEEASDMSNTLFTNVRIIDGTGAPPYAGEVLVQGNRISRVTRGGRPAPVAGVTIIDAAGATLMPGMTEAHVHLAWNNAATLDAIQLMPLEEHMLLTAANARLYLDRAGPRRSAPPPPSRGSTS